MRTRLFEPLGMSHTSVQSSRALVSGGTSASGLPIQPWIIGAYAPAGAVVSTTQDLAKLASALLDGTAPGLDALTPTAPTDASNTRIGDFWQISDWQNGQTITWHNGQTSGYTSFLGLDRAHHTAIIVLSDVSHPVDDLGISLLAQQR
jgi:CubicO group peptidase (beta-lactamase class C family)